MLAFSFLIMILFFICTIYSPLKRRISFSTLASPSLPSPRSAALLLLYLWYNRSSISSSTASQPSSSSKPAAYFEELDDDALCLCGLLSDLHRDNHPHHQSYRLQSHCDPYDSTYYHFLPAVAPLIAIAIV